MPGITQFCFLFLLLCEGQLACGMIAVGHSLPSSEITPTLNSIAHTEQPCAKVSASWAAQVKANVTYPGVSALLALQCLKSVPIGKQEAIDLIDAVEPYLEWQSDSTYKEDPPKSYYYPGYNMFSNLAKVRANVQAGRYASEFDFLTDLYRQVWAPGHDGHFDFYPDLLYSPFYWRRTAPPLVSISEDGKSLPVIKLQPEVLADGRTAQIVTMINGINASRYIQDTINAASHFQDADASYNSMFWSKAANVDGALGSFVGAGRGNELLYQGDTTTLSFANGTTIEFENKGYIIENLTGITDGYSMYKRFCTPRATWPMPNTRAGAGEASAPSVGASRNKPLFGYPNPMIASSDGAVSGYFLNGTGVDKVAVIYLKSFIPENASEFQAVISKFLRDAKAAGKTKLVVDLQQNAGGHGILAIDVFHAAKVVSNAVKDVEPRTEQNKTLVALSVSAGNYRHMLNISNKNFLTYEDEFTPRTYKHTNYTSLLRYNLTDPLVTTNRTYGAGIEVSGYGTRANLTQPFLSQDIVILMDGQCSSACNDLVEMLSIQGGVKSVAMGGRPRHGPMQGMGGVKGAEGDSLQGIYNYMQLVSLFNTDEVINEELRRFTKLPMQRSATSGVNVRDRILRTNVNDGVPAQYAAEYADCRLYWTAPMISGVTEIWKAAANAAFAGAECAFGGVSR